MVLVKAIARLSGLRRLAARAFSGFCSACQQPTILAASVMFSSLSPLAKCACKAASTLCSESARTTTL